MGFRFYKSVKLLPGIRLNVSKSGVSTTIGVPGANVNLGRKRRRYTVGLPGTGLSYSASSASRRDGGRTGLPVARRDGGWRWVVTAAVLIVLLILIF